MQLIPQQYNIYQFAKPGAFTPAGMNTSQFIDVLPVNQPTDIKFQIALDWQGSFFFFLYMMNRPITDFKIHVIDKIAPANAADVTSNIVATLPGTFERYAVGLNGYGSTYGVCLYWRHGIPNLSTLLAPGTCYHLVVEITNTSGPNDYFYMINPIQYVDSKYTSVIEFTDAQDSFSYYYPDALMTNRVRLNMHIDRPQYPTEQELYVSSKGARRTTKAVSRVTYQGSVKAATALLHKCIHQALLHDSVTIESADTTVKTAMESAYTIDYPDRPINNKSSANFVVGVSDRQVVNENSGILPTPGPAVDLQVGPGVYAYDIFSNFIDNGLSMTANVYNPNQSWHSSPACVYSSPGAWTVNFLGLASATTYTVKVQTTYSGNQFTSKFYTFTFTTL